MACTFAHSGWSFAWQSESSISSSSELEALSEALGTAGLPLPEMTYGTHFLEVRRGAALQLRFSAQGALASWHAVQSSNNVAVGGARLPVDVTTHDFTYTCEYGGELGGASVQAAPAASAAAAIPMDLISQRTPILAFASVPLYASDLNDRGTVEVGVKLRVMDTYFLVLCRAFTRIDRDRVRLRDVRYFHAFGEQGEGGQLRVLRDVQTRVGSVAQVAQAIAGGGGWPAPPLHRAMGSPVSPPPAAGRAGSGGSGDSSSSSSWPGATGPPLPVGLPSFFASAAAASSPTSPPPTSAATAAAATAAAPSPTSPTSPTSPSRPAVHPVVLASMRQRAEKQGLQVLDDGTFVGASGPVGGCEGGAGGGAPPEYAAAWPARPGAVLPPPLSPVALLHSEGKLPLLAVTAEDAFASLQAEQLVEVILAQDV